jgi:hypothetical protein
VKKKTHFFVYNEAEVGQTRAAFFRTKNWAHPSSEFFHGGMSSTEGTILSTEKNADGQFPSAL